MTEAPEAKRQKTNGFGHCSRRTSMEDDEVIAACFVFYVSLFMRCKLLSCIGMNIPGKVGVHPDAS